MTTHVAFLRGINVGGKVMLPMKELAALCQELGWAEVRTYINSGNVVFKSTRPEGKLEAALEKALFGKMGREIKVLVRTAEELAQIVARNPFPNGKPSQIGVLLLAARVNPSIEKEFVTPGSEEVVAGEREVYIHFPDGLGRSKLKWPASLKDGTVRNLNTLSKLVHLSRVTSASGA